METKSTQTAKTAADLFHHVFLLGHAWIVSVESDLGTILVHTAKYKICLITIASTIATEATCGIKANEAAMNSPL
jgi:hypothetical protein